MKMYSITVFLIAIIISLILDSSSTPCNRLPTKNQTFNALTTFIIPSTGRNSLRLTLESLVNQVDQNWFAIVIFDGILRNNIYLTSSCRPNFVNLPQNILNDNRICYNVMPIKAKGEHNCAGQIRNYGMKSVTTPWISFVDDDDTLDHRYLSKLRYEIQSNNNNKIDCIIFRMYDGEYYYPSWDENNFRLYDVGISFTFRSELFHNNIIKFMKSSVEDFLFLDTLRKLGYTILLSPDTLYWVNNKQIDDGINSSVRAIIREKPIITHFNQLDITNHTCYNTIENKTLPKFFFHSSSKKYGQRIKSLNSSIYKAINQGCMRNWNIPHQQIQFIFNSNSKPTSRYFIQIITEEKNLNHFTSQYIKQLNRSIQIWDFIMNSNIQYNNNKNKIDTNIYFIPSILTLSVVPTTTNKFTRNKIKCMKNPTAPTFERDSSWEVFDGHHVLSCHGLKYNSQITSSVYNYTNSINKTLSKCNHKCEKMKRYYETKNICNSTFHNQNVDVLLYGLHSKDHQSIYDELKSINLLSIWLKNAPGKIFEHFICKTKIVIISHDYFNSAVEIHKINYVLHTVGKIVVAVTSNDKLLVNVINSTNLIITHPDNLLNTVKIALDDYTSSASSSSSRNSNSNSKVSNTNKKLINTNDLLDRAVDIHLDPLCHALFNLRYDVIHKVG